MSPNHRPFFFSNFLAAFRAQQAAAHKAVGSTATVVSTPATTTSFSTAVAQHGAATTGSTTAAVRAMSSKAGTTPTQTASSNAVAIQTSSGTFQPSRRHHRHHTSTSPYSRSPSPGYSHTPPYPSNNSSIQQPSSSSSTALAATTSTSAASASTVVDRQSHWSSRNRRGSDSSNEGGFRDALAMQGQEKWYIGGRTAAGEERFYQLSMVRRPRSVDRLSLDRMSL